MPFFLEKTQYKCLGRTPLGVPPPLKNRAFHWSLHEIYPRNSSVLAQNSSVLAQNSLGRTPLGGPPHPPKMGQFIGAYTRFTLKEAFRQARATAPTRDLPSKGGKPTGPVRDRFSIFSGFWTFLIV